MSEDIRGRVGVLVLNFGEPDDPSPGDVVAFLERIFYMNADLESVANDEARRLRSRQLAERRAPGLIKEYAKIGPSPMNEQAHQQAHGLSQELGRRGYDAMVYSAFQFTPPLIKDVVERAQTAGINHLVALPIFPLCGPSTNIAALNMVQAALNDLRWNVELQGITGWHRHPLYLQLRADAIRKLSDRNGLDLSDGETRVIFSAHGTPKKYVDQGSRYIEYVEEFCEDIAQLLSLSEYEIGYQNHSNRGIEWTLPNVEDVIRSVRARRVIVDPVSFMHEQSETLAELDHGLWEEAKKVGLEFHRVPVPHDDPRFPQILADLVESQLTGGQREAQIRFGRCRCSPQPNTFCLNALPRSAATPAPTP